MKKEYYKQFIDPVEFADLYDEWTAEGKPQGNHPLYIKIWDGVMNAVKACIGALQARYHCQYQDYDDKVMDGTILIVNKLLKMEDTPRNIVTMSYLPVLGTCCGPKARTQEWNDNMLSTDIQTDEGDFITDILPDEQNY